MAPPNPLHHNAVFYPPPWDERYDRLFISSLVHELKCGRYRVGRRNPNAVLAAMKEVNHIFGTSFEYRFCLRRYNHLAIRYRLFRWLTRLSGVHYDPTMQHVDCSPDAWEWICEKEPLARAYIMRGETQYDSLKLLFQEGPDSPELVDLVSDTLIDLTNSDEEGVVETAPVVAAKGKKISESEAIMEGKQVSVAGILEVPDNTWWEDVADDGQAHDDDDWEDVAMGDDGRKVNIEEDWEGADEEDPMEMIEVSDEEDPEEDKQCEVGEETPGTKLSSTDPPKKREPIVPPTGPGRRLFDDDDSSASFSPSHKPH